MPSNNLRARLRSALGSGPAQAELISAMGGTPFGNVFYVAGSSESMGASNNNDGLASDAPLATMAQAMTNIGALNTRYKSNGIIWVTGDVRGAAVAPLGAYGWKIIGAAGGRWRHTTSNGVVLAGNGATWREAASAEALPLLLLREQGWEVHNMMFMPQSGYAGVQLRRDEDATYPDPSHAVFGNVKFISPGTRVGYGIQDIGQSYNLLVEECEFQGLEYAYYASAGGAFGGAAPGHHNWLNNKFTGNKNDIGANFVGSRFHRNRFLTPWHTTNHLNTLNLATTASSGDANDVNYVTENYFADVAAAVLISKGYKAATGDIWRNYVSDTAAQIVTVPTA